MSELHEALRAWMVAGGAVGVGVAERLIRAVVRDELAVTPVRSGSGLLHTTAELNAACEAAYQRGVLAAGQAQADKPGAEPRDCPTPGACSAVSANQYHQSLGAKWMNEAIVRWLGSEEGDKHGMYEAQAIARSLNRVWENRAFWGSPFSENANELEVGDPIEWLSARDGMWKPGVFVRHAGLGDAFIRRTDEADGSKGFRCVYGEWRRP